MGSTMHCSNCLDVDKSIVFHCSISSCGYQLCGICIREAFQDNQGINSPITCPHCSHMDINCLTMCSCCCKQSNDSIIPFKRCGACKSRTYCRKECQKIDWNAKLGNHKGCCGSLVHKNPSHQPWCAYLDRDPELDRDCLVTTGGVKSHPRELITTGMNTCMFVVVKTTDEVIGWHASLESITRKVRTKLSSITKANFVSGFIIPGEDRTAGTLDLKLTCRTMQVFPFNDPTHSRRIILGFLQKFEYYESLQVMPPIESYKDFVVFDMCHKRPYSFSNVAQFDGGCTYDAAHESPR